MVRASGVSVARIVFSVLKGGLALVIVAILIGEVVAPYCERLAETRRARRAEVSQHRGDGYWIREGAASSTRFGCATRRGRGHVHLRDRRRGSPAHRDPRQARPIPRHRLGARVGAPERRLVRRRRHPVRPARGVADPIRTRPRQARLHPPREPVGAGPGALHRLPAGQPAGNRRVRARACGRRSSIPSRPE